MGQITLPHLLFVPLQVSEPQCRTHNISDQTPAFSDFPKKEPIPFSARPASRCPSGNIVKKDQLAICGIPFLIKQKGSCQKQSPFLTASNKKYHPGCVLASTWLIQAGLLTCASSLSPVFSSYSLILNDVFGSALRLQWRDRAGLSPASLLKKKKKLRVGT